MITFETMSDMVEAVNQNRIPAVLAQDIARAFDGTGEIDWPTAALEQIEELMGENYTALFMDQVGGTINVCETEEDLKQILNYDQEFFAANGREPNITDQPASWDVMNFVFDNPEHKYVAAAMMTNNLGGSLYYVPESLYGAARIKEHFEKQHAYMQSMFGGEDVFNLQ